MDKKDKVFLVRDLESGDFLEKFLVSAVLSVLGVRLILYILKYPEISGGSLHIAHMLWGGLLMMISLLSLFTFLNREIKHLGAIIGGIGFGMFIDELGKFITADNNYFYRPTIAWIYVVFILVFLFARFSEKFFVISTQEYAVNVLEILKEALIHGFDEDERKQALIALSHSNREDQTVSLLKKLVLEIEAADSAKLDPFTKFRVRMRNFYRKVILQSWFSRIIILFFVVHSFFGLLSAFAAVFVENSFSAWGQFYSSMFATILIIIGIYFIIFSKRVKGFLMFKYSILVSIFLTQFFAFLRDQFSAVYGLVGAIFIFNILLYLIHQEVLLEKGQ